MKHPQVKRATFTLLELPQGQTQEGLRIEHRLHGPLHLKKPRKLTVAPEGSPYIFQESQSAPRTVTDREAVKAEGSLTCPERLLTR